jgi:hypothetical protein
MLEGDAFCTAPRDIPCIYFALHAHTQRDKRSVPATDWSIKGQQMLPWSNGQCFWRKIKKSVIVGAVIPVTILNP